MRKHLRAAVVAATATAVVGITAGGALACETPAPTGTEAAAHVTPAKKAHEKRIYVKTVELRGGMTAKVYKLKKGHQADLFLGRVKLGTITAVHENAYTINDGTKVKLTPAGQITSWQHRAVVPPQKPGKPCWKHKHDHRVKPGERNDPNRKPQICPPGPVAKPEICPPGPVDRTPDAAVLPADA
ncbi:hypothetical protein ACN20G_30620 (plasmid) [Streptomyces sp. BI20]|uniref:hypothetical protein n=1 Tax=Streptomyces sp. BI20 TaxID=3403460 RepID=UPI003C72B16D